MYAYFNINYDLIAFTLDDSRARFQIELEFVQCLANPNYLNCNLNSIFLNNVI